MHHKKRDMEGDVIMSRKLIIDGNAVYELDEECMLRQRVEAESTETEKNGIIKENDGPTKKDTN